MFVFYLTYNILQQLFVLFILLQDFFYKKQHQPLALCGANKLVPQNFGPIFFLQMNGKSHNNLGLSWAKLNSNRNRSFVSLYCIELIHQNTTCLLAYILVYLLAC